MRTAVRNVALEMALQQRSIGRRIAQLREKAHMTQEAAADKVGVTLRAYQKWEAGGGIQYANLERLAKLYGTTVDNIVGNESTPDPFRTGSQLDRMEQALADISSRLARLETALIQADPAGQVLAALEDLSAQVAEQAQADAPAPTEVPPANAGRRSRRAAQPAPH